MNSSTGSREPATYQLADLPTHPLATGPTVTLTHHPTTPLGDLGSISSTFTTMGGRTVGIHIFTEPSCAGQLEFAMTSIKKAFKWDEDMFGRGGIGGRPRVGLLRVRH